MMSNRFRAGKGCVEKNFTLKQIGEKMRGRNRKVYVQNGHGNSRQERSVLEKREVVANVRNVWRRDIFLKKVKCSVCVRTCVCVCVCVLLCENSCNAFKHLTQQQTVIVTVMQYIKEKFNFICSLNTKYCSMLEINGHYILCPIRGELRHNNFFYHEICVKDII